MIKNNKLQLNIILPKETENHNYFVRDEDTNAFLYLSQNQSEVETHKSWIRLCHNLEYNFETDFLNFNQSVWF